MGTCLPIAVVYFLFMLKLDCILLVDDDEITNFVHETIIEEVDAAERVLVAKNGREALDVIKKQAPEHSGTPCLILLDINMPIMNGFEFLEAYCQLPTNIKQSVIIVMLTSSLNPKDAERIRGSEATDFVNKPLNKIKLKEVLKKHFSE